MTPAIPPSLADWDLSLLESFANENVPETDRHDYKASLPDGRTLNKVCCAFANTRGGFIILGMQQDGGNVALAGVEPNLELGKHIHDRLHVEPSLSIPTPKEIPIDGTDKVAYIVHIPESPRKPHLPTNKDQRIFWRRVDAACEQMNRDLVKMQFEQTEQRIRRLHMALRSIQDYIGTIANRANHDVTRRGARHTEVAPFINRPPLDAGQTATEEISALVHFDQQLVRCLQVIRDRFRWIDTKIELTIAQTQPGTNNELFSHHNVEIREAGKVVQRRFAELVSVLKRRDEQLLPEGVQAVNYIK